MLTNFLMLWINHRIGPEAFLCQFLDWYLEACCRYSWKTQPAKFAFPPCMYCRQGLKEMLYSSVHINKSKVLHMINFWRPAAYWNSSVDCGVQNRPIIAYKVSKEALWTRLWYYQRFSIKIIGPSKIRVMVLWIHFCEPTCTVHHWNYAGPIFQAN